MKRILPLLTELRVVIVGCFDRDESKDSNFLCITSFDRSSETSSGLLCVAIGRVFEGMAARERLVD